MKFKVTTKFILAVYIIFNTSHGFALTLQEAVKHVLKTNPEALAAENEYESRKYEVSQAKAGYLPTLDFDAGVGKETRRAASTGNEEIDLDRRELGLAASQILFDGFATKTEVERQRARLDSALHSYDVTKNELALDTSDAYLDVLRFGDLLSLAQASLWEHQNIYDQMKLRSDKGVGSKADLDQISARLALANSNMIVAQNNFADTQVTFHRLTGMYPNLDSMVKPVIHSDLPKTRDEAIEVAVDNHPTLSSAGADVRAAHAQYKAAASGYWPVVTLEAEKRWDDNVGVAGEDEDLIVALRLRYNLFGGGADKARRKQTAYLMSESKDIRNNSRRQVVESMSLSWNSYDALSKQQRYLEAHVKAAESTKAAYGKQFNIGRRTLLDLLNTETEVIDSRRSLINAEYDRLYSAYRIFNAAGQLAAILN